jgi:hypothetical protein
MPRGAWTHTVVMRSRTGTVRYITAHHRFDRLSRITDIYGAGNRHISWRPTRARPRVSSSA